MMLHPPFTNVQDQVDGSASFSAAYRICKTSHSHDADYLELDDSDTSEDEDEFEESTAVEDEK